MEDRIRAFFVYEILGKPKEHIKETLEMLVKKIGENPGFNIINSKVHEPNLVDEEKMDRLNSKELFSTFAEVEIEINNLSNVFALVMNTLPSNIEIIEPRELKIKNFDFTSLLTELTIKLHKYDEIAKALSLEKNQMVNIIKEMDRKIKDLGGESIVRFEENKDNNKISKDK